MKTTERSTSSIPERVPVSPAAVENYFRSVTDDRIYFCDSSDHPVGCSLTSVDFPTRRISISRNDLAERFTLIPVPYGPTSELSEKIQAVLEQLVTAKRYTYSDRWRVWKEAACETIFERHGPQWEDEDEKTRFAENELRIYFRQGMSPAEAEQDWWRTLCDTIPRRTATSQHPEWRKPDGFSLTDVYDCVLVRTAREMKERLSQLEERSPASKNKYVVEMRRSLKEMEHELARRGIQL